MRVALLGAGGMLASDLAALSPPTVTLHALGIAELDVTDDRAVTQVLYEMRPDVIINASAYTNVDSAEDDAELAFAVNGHAPGVIGTAAKAIDAAVVHYSTDYVFDGRAKTPYDECHPTAPLGVYGASKLRGEGALASSGARYLVIRTQWLFGIHGRSFPGVMWDRALQRAPTRVVNDQVGRPTYTVDLARATWQLLETEAFQRTEIPVLHVANQGTATWFDVARRIFSTCDRSDLVTPCSTEDYPTAATRPMWSVLSTRRYESLSGQPLPDWRNAVDRYLAVLGEHAPRA